MNITPDNQFERERQPRDPELAEVLEYGRNKNHEGLSILARAMEVMTRLGVFDNPAAESERPEVAAQEVTEGAQAVVHTMTSRTVLEGATREESVEMSRRDVEDSYEEAA